MTLEALTEALADTKWYHRTRSAAVSPKPTRDLATAILAALTANGYTIAPVAEAEAGRAVLGFIATMDPDDIDARFDYVRGLRGKPDSWEVSSFGRVGEGPTLPEAVAALQDEEGRT